MRACANACASYAYVSVRVFMIGIARVCLCVSQGQREEQSQKTESCRENLWNDIQLKGP